MLSKIIRIIVRLLARTDASLPESIARDMNISLGRGSGAASIESEVSSATSILLQSQQLEFVAFDIGANLGEYTAELLSTRKFTKIFCFEPSMSASKTLYNRFSNTPQVQILNVALGAKEERAQLYSDTDSSGLASLTKRRLDHFGIDFNLSQEVQVNTLDRIITELNVTPDLIKIDVEGHELDVLLGAQEKLKRIKLIQFEFGGANIDTRTFFQDFWYFFQGKGFKLFRITPGGLIKIDSYLEEDEYFKPTNILAKNCELL
jgi:FkbM family methyltransferase